MKYGVTHGTDPGEAGMLAATWIACVRVALIVASPVLGASAPAASDTPRSTVLDPSTITLRMGRIPGHAAVYGEKGTNWMSFHFYDGDGAGAATLGIRRFELDAEG